MLKTAEELRWVQFDENSWVANINSRLQIFVKKRGECLFAGTVVSVENIHAGTGLFVHGKTLDSVAKEMLAKVKEWQEIIAALNKKHGEVE